MKAVCNKDIYEGGYSIQDMKFSEMTNLLMILKAVDADVNGECYDLRKKMIEEITEGVYGIPDEAKKNENNNFLEKLFIKLLKWFCAKRLDQWERWKINTEYGPVYIQIIREDDGYNWNEIK